MLYFVQVLVLRKTQIYLFPEHSNCSSSYLRGISTASQYFCYYCSFNFLFLKLIINIGMMVFLVVSKWIQTSYLIFLHIILQSYVPHFHNLNTTFLWSSSYFKNHWLAKVNKIAVHKTAIFMNSMIKGGSFCIYRKTSHILSESISPTMQ